MKLNQFLFYPESEKQTLVDIIRLPSIKLAQDPVFMGSGYPCHDDAGYPGQAKLRHSIYLFLSDITLQEDISNA